jgi:hypothetical protein
VIPTSDPRDMTVEDLPVWGCVCWWAGHHISTEWSQSFSFVRCSQHINKYLVEEICVLDPTASNVEVNVELVTSYIQGKGLPGNLNIY